MRFLILAPLCLLLSLGAHADAAGLAAYQQQAKTLLFKLQQQKGDDIEAQAKQLVELSKPLLSDFRQQYPQCTEYLQALNDVADTLADLPLEEIESGYHADGKLPTLPTAECYHAKDLLVHPATVQAMARIGLQQADDWIDAAHEIEEVLEHFGQVQIAIGH
ncbi:hypothetical protein CHH28_00640 [Bacterioplanes sanyensis]|uniref:Uncharacterized protein n=1 Tax=Bacterioplanes sanyensis TaxID=1249553 RepID=A0A222FET9_9GAMM|nr:hypothetical protein [Bacterioplanes sanyensis]ASP37280.1 hypothetical protein CHH28_00640 [Bacterioplanes sanyensis]